MLILREQTTKYSRYFLPIGLLAGFFLYYVAVQGSKYQLDFNALEKHIFLNINQVIMYCFSLMKGGDKWSDNHN